MAKPILLQALVTVAVMYVVFKLLPANLREMITGLQSPPSSIAPPATINHAP